MNYLNYWSLYMEFIEEFGEVAYRGIPLPLLRFGRYLNSNLKSKIRKKSFVRNLKSGILRRSNIQPTFDLFLKEVKKKNTIKTKDGYVVIYNELLRLPADTLQEYFDPKKTIRIRNKRISASSTYKQVVLNQRYGKPALKKQILRNQEKARKIFSKLHEHPIFGDKNFQDKFLRAIPTMIRTIENTNRFFDEFSSACIITGTTETLFPRALTLVGHTRGIPSICLQHGNIVGEFSYMPVFSSKMAIHGDIERKWYLRRGVVNERLAVIGHPRFDIINRKNFLSKSEFRTQLNLGNKEKKTVLVATQPRMQSSVYKEIITSLAEDPSIEVIIKPHPKEIKKKLPRYERRMRLYKSLAAKNESIKLLTNEMNLYDILNNVDAVVIWSSTVGLEAMLFGKPVFMLDRKLPKEYYSSFKDLQPFIHSDPGKLAATIQKNCHSEEALEKALSDFHRFISKIYPHKNAGANLNKLIRELAASKPDVKNK